MMDKILSYYQDAKKLIKGGMILPRMISIWLTTNCNLKCGFCIVEGEYVILDNEDKIRVENVDIGSMIKCYDEKLKKDSSTEVKEVFKRKTNGYYKLELEDGKILCATGEHPIKTKRGWIKIEELLEEDEILIYE